jgi:hypothetical protein
MKNDLCLTVNLEFGEQRRIDSYLASFYVACAPYGTVLG